jgi:phosphoribosylamine--glycine ligase
MHAEETSMKALVIGKGGREHALAKALAESPSIDQVFALPGSQAMQPTIQCVEGAITAETVIELCTTHSLDFVVIGPEDPLVEGLADPLRAKNIPVFGPDQRGAQLEGSKIFSKEFMVRYNIPTADFSVVTSKDEVMQEAEKFKPPFVLKADGLAAGKGVFICQTLSELEEAAESLFVKKSLGEAGQRALMEQFQPGYELSFFILTNGTDFTPLPMAQDHKRLLDKDEGPNTGGMGTVAPLGLKSKDYEAIIEQVVKPTVKGLSEEGFTYRGVVFIGIMMTEAGPQVLEYNIRFGDPETQVLLPLLDGDWGEAFMAVAQGQVPDLQWKSQFACCVVLAAEGYPSSPVKGVAITGDLSSSERQYFLHAGTREKDGQWLVDGGRVLNAVGLGATLEESMEAAYAQARKVRWPHRQMRTDIGKKLLTK